MTIAPPIRVAPRHTLDENAWLNLVLAVVVCVSIARIASTWRVFSQTTDEPTHIAAGFDWWATDRTDVDAEHPPLARAFFAVVPFLEGAQVDASSPRNARGNEILERGGRYRRNLARTRAGNIPFFILGVLIVMLWAKRLGGPATAMIAVALFASLPPILGHAGLATTDMASAATLAAALYAWTRWLDDGSWPRTIVAGLAIGAGLLAKLSFVLFFPLCAAALVIARRTRMRFGRAAAMLAIAMLVSWAGYKFSVGKLNDARLTVFPDESEEHVAARYAAVPGYEWVRADLVRRYWTDAVAIGGGDFVDWARAAGYPSPLAERSGHDTVAGRALPPRPLRETLLEPVRAVRQWIAVRVPIPAPMFFAGLEYVARHSRTGHRAFLLGRHSTHGWWYYFPVILFFKTPLPFLALSIMGLWLFAREGGERRGIAIAALLILGAAMTGGINIGVRHILAIYPLLAIAAGVATRRLWAGRSRAVVLVLLAWFGIGTATAHPDYLPWFNECALGHPERITFDSNLDWGQDLLRLERIVRREKIDRLSFGYTGSADWHRRLPFADPLPCDTPVSGWIAISESELGFNPDHDQ